MIAYCLDCPACKESIANPLSAEELAMSGADLTERMVKIPSLLEFYREHSEHAEVNMGLCEYVPSNKATELLSNPS